jgi:hypothetical protein
MKYVWLANLSLRIVTSFSEQTPAFQWQIRIYLSLLLTISDNLLFIVTYLRVITVCNYSEGPCRPVRGLNYKLETQLPEFGASFL